MFKAGERTWPEKLRRARKEESAEREKSFIDGAAYG
jgi:hypothetical protein